MYKLEFLPVAKDDMLEIIKYISGELKNKQAAENLAEEFISAAESLRQFPYSHQVYSPLKPLETEYRKVIVKNYLMFYTVDEKEKTVTIMRVIYARRDLTKQID